jgi:hypothetical protein
MRFKLGNRPRAGRVAAAPSGDAHVTGCEGTTKATVVVLFDGSEVQARAVSYAVGVAQRYGVGAAVVVVIETPAPTNIYTPELCSLTANRAYFDCEDLLVGAALEWRRGRYPSLGRSGLRAALLTDRADLVVVSSSHCSLRPLLRSRICPVVVVP